jgi:hypothetical protein
VPAEAQWPPPWHWPRPAAADGGPCGGEVVNVEGKGRAVRAARQLLAGEEVGSSGPRVHLGPGGPPSV